MIRKLVTLAVLSALSTTLSTTVMAEEKRSWDASAELGFNLTSGNTDTSSFKTRVNVKHHLQNWENVYIFDALKKKEEIDGQDNTSADKRLYSAKGNYRFGEEETFFFVEGERAEDKKGVYNDYNTVAVGYGTTFYETEEWLFKADVGPGYTFYELNDSGASDSSSIVRASANLEWKFSETGTFSQKLDIKKELSGNKDLGGSKNTRSSLESAVSASLYGSLKMKFGFSVLNNSVVPVGTKKTDTETSVTLVYSF